MTPDELTCTTCEGEGAVVCQAGDEYPNTEEEVACCIDFAIDHPFPWEVDACPECGRGREVGKL